MDGPNADDSQRATAVSLARHAQAALTLCAESVAANPDWDFTWWVIAAAAGEAGDIARAKEAFRNLRRIGPASTLTFPSFRIFREEQRREKLPSGLRKAGMAE